MNKIRISYQPISLIIMSSLVALFVTGCSQQPQSGEPTAPPPPTAPSAEQSRATNVAVSAHSLAPATSVPAIPTSAVTQAPPVISGAASIATQAVPAITAASSNMTAQIKDMADTANQKFTGLVQQVQDFIKQNNLTEAAAKLAEITKLSLTPEQQQVVDQLKAQVEKALASKTGQEIQKGLNNLLGGSK